MRNKFVLLASLAVLMLSGTSAWATLNYSQGFEVDASGWTVSQAITRTASGGGALGLTASAGAFYAEIENLPDGYDLGYGDAGYSFYGGSDSVYNGDFYQSIDVYIDVNWPVPAAPSVPAIWIDMTPYHADPGNFGAEHNFRLTATGTTVEVRVDGAVSPMATLTTSGWYTFLMTFEKDINPANPVITNMEIYDAAQALVATTQVLATSPGGPMLSSDLLGNGYVWITLWQNGFAGDVLGIDNQSTGLLPLDSDLDGVPAWLDSCSDTTADMFNKLGTNRWKWNGTAWVSTGKGKSTPTPYDMVDTRGCSCTQILDELSALTGGDFSGHYKFGCSKSIIDEWIAARYRVDSVVVPAVSETPTVSNINLLDTVPYELRASGVANAGDNIDFDADYSLSGNVPLDTWSDDVTGYEFYGSDLLDLMVDGGFVNWGVFNMAHTYSYLTSGTGAPVSFLVNDLYYPNNTGSLLVDIYVVLP